MHNKPSQRLNAFIEALQAKKQLGSTEGILVSRAFFKALHTDLGSAVIIRHDPQLHTYYFKYKGIIIRRHDAVFEGEAFIPYILPEAKQ